jgi:acetone carboxylase gamma subunit
MRVDITEYLAIDLTDETWRCRHCDTVIAPARGNYKEGLLVYDRDPREIHRPILNPDLYEFTYAPDPKWCRIIEYYCPECGTQMETEYLPPGHPLTHDIELDIDAMKQRFVASAGTGSQE